MDSCCLLLLFDEPLSLYVQNGLWAFLLLWVEMSLCSCQPFQLTTHPLPPFPLPSDFRTVHAFLQQKALADLLNAFPNVEDIPHQVVQGLPLTDLCASPKFHRHLAFWGTEGILRKEAIVDHLIKLQQMKPAKIMARKFGFNLAYFPTLLQYAYTASFSHWVFSESMTYDLVGQLCAYDRLALRAFVSWTRVSHKQAGRCAIAMGLEDPEESKVWFSEFDLPHMSRQEAFAIWFKGKTLFPVEHPIEDALLSADIRRLMGPTNGIITLASLDLRLEDIELVNSLERFYQIIPFIDEAGIVGLDCEWRPSLTGDHIYPVALIQVALRHKQTQRLQCYLIDIYTLRKAKQHDPVLERLDALFLDEDVLKVGCQFRYDLQMLGKTTSQGSLFREMRNYVDVTTIVRESKDPQFQGGLSKAALEILGEEMDKSQQCANWEIRPLTLAQAIYAAMDAVVCVALAEKTNQKARPKAQSLVDEENGVKVASPGKNKSKTSGHKNQSEGVEKGQSTEILEARLAAWHRLRASFVPPIEADTPIGLLDNQVVMAKALRSFGFTVTMFPKKDWSVVAQICAESGTVALLTPTDLKSLELHQQTNRQGPSFRYLIMGFGPVKQKIKKVIWMWSAAPLSNSIGCLEDGHPLGPSKYEGVLMCRNRECSARLAEAQVQWYNERNRQELVILSEDLDILATEHGE
eukprot:Protomagalhaensia_sp_Gyna_25__3433@NODE_309_length_3960_cov_85_063759_g240_i0_p1_GENE_NODE_309_length_3960_cov_85_063759_g240_i0NODE_309_length_3960_cov_85_063759_g240_i0_p1_ORF_typecomplete_len691_score119_00DNA_pol_A_exo1/PF01612_20/1_6e31DNA_pol_A_exo1/PF01612_20/1_1e04_NODE_309_length_3960_cov_85_063759_g240_i014373509